MGIFFLALFLPSLYYNSYLKNEILSETQVKATRDLSLIKDLMEREEEFQSPEQVYAWLRRASDILKVRITYVAEGGRVIADTDVPFDRTASLDNHAKRPEIVEAYNQPTGASFRYSGTINTDLLYVAQRIQGRGKIPGGVLRLAMPLSLHIIRTGQVRHRSTPINTYRLFHFCSDKLWPHGEHKPFGQPAFQRSRFYRPG